MSMVTVREILETKGREVVSVTPDQTVLQAIDKLTAFHIGSVLVLEESAEGGIVGILTERDVLKIVHRHLPRLESAKVEEFMTREVVCAVPEDDLDYVMDVMTRNRFRRMPVIEGGQLVGLISIGDVVKALKSHREYENRLLRDYISGTYA